MDKKILIFIGLFLTGSLFAKPEGESIKNGNCVITRSDTSTNVIQISDRAIIHWNEFSINSNEQVKFTQPSKEASVLNRVIGQNPSYIYGHLSSNGKIYLVNESGIFIGPNGTIRTAGFIASTLKFSDENFLLNDLHFEGGSNSKIINEGSIEAVDENIFLISKEIVNTGSLKAKKGLVALASSSEVFFISKPDGVVIKVEGSGKTEQKGQIEAAEAQIIASGGDVYPLAINHEGTSNISGIKKVDGRLYLIADSGKIEVSGKLSATKKDEGGSIRILAEDIHLKDQAEIKASGVLNGGDILIGGDYKGKNSEIPNAKNILIDEEVSIFSDAIERGDGGKIIIWSDDKNWMSGKVYARGGLIRGNGGFVEISSKEFMSFQGFVDVTANNGDNGILLFDPWTVTITDEIVDQNMISNPEYYPTNSGANLTPSTIETILNTGTSITIMTSSSEEPYGGEVGNISILSPIENWTGLGDLILKADGHIDINANITCLSNASFIASAEGQINVAEGVTVTNTYTGSNLFAETGAISLTGNGNLFDSYHGININGAKLISHKGNIFLDGIGGFDDSGLYNSGINIDENASIEAFNEASIYLNGQGKNTLALSSAGVNIDSSVISLENGDLSITGKIIELVSSDRHQGICISSSYISSVGGNIFLNGIGGNGVSSNTGIFLDSVEVDILNGNFNLNGCGGNGSSSENHGIHSKDSLIQITEGTFAAVGRGGVGDGYDIGFFTSDTGQSNLISVINGEISITAYGGGSSDTTNNYGMKMANDSLLYADNTSSIYINAIGGIQNNSNLVCENTGLVLDDQSQIVTVLGEITLLATGGSGYRSHGMELRGDTNLPALVSEESGNINLIGFGRALESNGIEVNRSIFAKNGNILLKGSGLLRDIAISAGTIGGENSKSSITLAADTLDFTAQLQTSSSVTLLPKQVNGSIAIGDNLLADLVVDTELLSNILPQNFSKLVFGSPFQSHKITVGDGSEKILNFASKSIELRGNTIQINNPINMGAKNFYAYVGQTAEGKFLLNKKITSTGQIYVYGGDFDDLFVIKEQTQIGVLEGGKGITTLQGPDDPTWKITGVNSGSLEGISFSNMNNLKGGNDVDVFIMYPNGRITGEIDGGGGYNTLDYTKFGSSVYVSFDYGIATNVGHFTNIQLILGDITFILRESMLFDLTKIRLGMRPETFGNYMWTPYQIYLTENLFPKFDIFVPKAEEDEKKP